MTVVLLGLLSFFGGVTALALLFARFMRRNDERARAALDELDAPPPSASTDQKAGASQKDDQIA